MRVLEDEMISMDPAGSTYGDDRHLYQQVNFVNYICLQVMSHMLFLESRVNLF